jgi:NADPH:quinone reductase-like Zn-dependent oxidoreductase
MQKPLTSQFTEAIALSSLGAPLDGMLAEYVVLHEDGVVHVPEHLTDEEAATLPVAALTAWNALITGAGVKAGDTVLVQGTGGVSLFALQFAKMMGARVILTSSSDKKLERARKLGASDSINYKSIPDWDQRVRELTGGIGVDHILEVGGAGTFAKSLNAIRTGGYIGIIGALTGTTTEINLLTIIFRNVQLKAVSVGNRQMFEAMNRAIALHQLRPVVDRVFPFEETPEAFQYMKSGDRFGKICIRI